MNREIKFRVWNQEKKIMDYEKFIIAVDIGGNTCVFDDWRDHEDYVVSKSILMQFTGLLDKNRKEIYEGDILSWINDKDIYLVYYDDDRCAFYCTQKRKFHENEFHLGIDLSIKIIGNIYQNPELLETSK